MNRPRCAWFCFEFVAALCACAFIAGLFAGIVATLHFVRGGTTPPAMRATVATRDIPAPTPRVRTKGEPQVFSF